MNNFISSKSVIDHLKKSIETIYSKEEAQAISFIIVREVFGVSKSDVLLNKEIPGKEDEIDGKILPIIERLLKNEPIQYILGETEFYNCKIKVNPSVLIPRQETEELVDVIISENQRKKDLKILDICTGSGCIAIALQKNVEKASTYALDISEDALNTAAENAKLNGVDILFEQKNILENDVPWEKISFNIIVSNPPYVKESEKNQMLKNVLEHEPCLALFVKDDDPLVFYKRIVRISVERLVPGGVLYFEINEQFGQDVRKLFQENSFTDITVIKDLQGKDRIVKGVMPLTF